MGKNERIYPRFDTCMVLYNKDCLQYVIEEGVCMWAKQITTLFVNVYFFFHFNFQFNFAAYLVTNIQCSRQKCINVHVMDVCAVNEVVQPSFILKVQPERDVSTFYSPCRTYSGRAAEVSGGELSQDRDDEYVTSVGGSWNCQHLAKHQPCPLLFMPASSFGTLKQSLVSYLTLTLASMLTFVGLPFCSRLLCNWGLRYSGGVLACCCRSNETLDVFINT